MVCTSRPACHGPGIMVGVARERPAGEARREADFNQTLTRMASSPMGLRAPSNTSGELLHRASIY